MIVQATTVGLGFVLFFDHIIGRSANQNFLVFQDGATENRGAKYSSYIYAVINSILSSCLHLTNLTRGGANDRRTPPPNENGDRGNRLVGFPVGQTLRQRMGLI